MHSPSFLVYPQFNAPELLPYARMKHRIHSLPPELFPTNHLPDRLAQALARHRVVHVKELLEAFEFYRRVRRRVRRPAIVDLCAGHGLAGLIFALCERSVSRVILLDERRPETFDRILDAFVDVGPWVRERVSYRTASLEGPFEVPEGAGVLLVHACGSLTDRGLAMAIGGKNPVAAMACCYGKADPPRVPGLSRALGRPTTIDVSRSYRLHDAGFQVDWSDIPSAITPMNRILIGWNHHEQRCLDR